MDFSKAYEHFSEEVKKATEVAFLQKMELFWDYMSGLSDSIGEMVATDKSESYFIQYGDSDSLGVTLKKAKEDTFKHIPDFSMDNYKDNLVIRDHFFKFSFSLHMVWSEEEMICVHPRIDLEKKFMFKIVVKESDEDGNKILDMVENDMELDYVLFMISTILGSFSWNEENE